MGIENFISPLSFRTSDARAGCPWICCASPRTHSGSNLLTQWFNKLRLPMKADLQPDAQRVGFTVNPRCSPRGSSLTTCSRWSKTFKHTLTGTAQATQQATDPFKPSGPGHQVNWLSQYSGISRYYFCSSVQAVNADDAASVCDSAASGTCVAVARDQICRLQMWRFLSVALLTKVTWAGSWDV